MCVSNWRQHQQMSTQSVTHISKRRCVPFSSSTIIVVSIESTELQRQRTGPLGCALVVVPVVVVVVVVVVDVGWFAFLACQQRSSPELFLPHLWQSLGHLSVSSALPQPCFRARATRTQSLCDHERFTSNSVVEFWRKHQKRPEPHRPNRRPRR